MKIQDLKHLIKATSGITNETTFVIVGSQSALLQFPDLPDDMTRSMEIDIFSPFRPGFSVVISGCIGEYSPFHESCGYYADGVGPETVILPKDWEDRAIRVEIPDSPPLKAIAPEIHDLAVSKLIAGREKDISWISCGIVYNLIDPQRVHELLTTMDITQDVYQLASNRLSRIATENEKNPEP